MSIPDMDAILELPSLVLNEKFNVELPYNAFAVKLYQRYMVGLNTLLKYAQHLPGCKIYLKTNNCTCGLFKDKEMARSNYWKSFDPKIHTDPRKNT